MIGVNSTATPVKAAPACVPQSSFLPQREATQLSPEPAQDEFVKNEDDESPASTDVSYDEARAFAAIFQPQYISKMDLNHFVSNAELSRTVSKQGILRVAAYIRVSTDSTDQENSYETQDKYFTSLIQKNPDWTSAGVYADYGISGTNKERRTGYKRLLRHCQEGKIDRIVCKSISRFARNTSDFMTALDILHDNHVTILFEKENLDTQDSASSFILTTLAAIAQEESRTISTNIQWSNQKRFPKGHTQNIGLYGYYYPVWRCTKNGQGASHGCTSGSTYECALEQSFMENLYWLKRDLEAHGDDSWLMRQFAAACEKMERASGRNSYSSQRLQTVEMQIRELEEKLNKTVANQMEAMRMEALEKTAEAKHSLEDGSIDDVPVDITNGISTVGLGTQWFCGDEINSDSEAAIYEELANDIRDRIADLKKERDALELEQGATTIASKNFDFFIRCLKALPETNYAGMQMNVNGLDVQGSLFRDMEGKAIAGKRSDVRSGHIKITGEKLADAPDYLNFEKGIYVAFIKSRVVKGDTVEYQTNFGVTLVTAGNSRNLSSFLGFRRANSDGTVTFLDEKWKVSGRSVCRTRKKRQVQDMLVTGKKWKEGEEPLPLINPGV